MDKSLIYPEDADRVRQVLSEILDLIVPAVAATGITATELEQIAADRFIKHVLASYGLRKRKTNISRLALITGHSRKASKAISTSPAPTSFEFIRPNQSAVYRVLARWRTSPEYQDEMGNVRELPWEGPDSLSALIKGVSADIPCGAVRYELIRNNYARESKPGIFAITGISKPAVADAGVSRLETVAKIISELGPANLEDL